MSCLPSFVLCLDGLAALDQASFGCSGVGSLCSAAKSYTCCCASSSLQRLVCRPKDQTWVQGSTARPPHHPSCRLNPQPAGLSPHVPPLSQTHPRSLQLTFLLQTTARHLVAYMEAPKYPATLLRPPCPQIRSMNPKSPSQMQQLGARNLVHRLAATILLAATSSCYIVQPNYFECELFWHFSGSPCSGSTSLARSSFARTLQEELVKVLLIYLRSGPVSGHMLSFYISCHLLCVVAHT